MKKLLCLGLVLALVLAGCGRPVEESADTTAPDFGAMEDAIQSTNDAEPEVGNDTEIPAEPAVEAPADLSHITVTGEYAYGDMTMALVVTATDSTTGEVVWTYTTPDCAMAQLTPVQLVNVANNMVYVNQQAHAGDDGLPNGGGDLVALDLATGEVLWRNTDFTGAEVFHVFDEAGNLYIGGFFGPDCCAIAPDGTTLWLVEQVEEAWYWPWQIVLEGDRLTITYSGGPNGDGEYFGYLSLDGEIL